MPSPTPRPGILDIAPYIPGKSKAAGGGRVIKLSSNETPLGPSLKAIAAYREAGDSLHRYPDGGSEVLTQALGRHYGLDPRGIVCGNGSDEILALLARAYAGPGDEVLYTEHGFLVYPIAALSAGATPVAAPETDLTADVDTLLARVTERTKLCFIANPNNPTGTYISAEALQRLRDGLPDEAVLVVDSAYAEYVTRNDYTAGAEMVEAGDNVVMTRTFSKIFGLAALRLGWAYCPPAIADVLHRTRGPFNVNAAAQAAGLAALGDVAFTDAARRHNDIWRPWLEEAIARLGYRVRPSVANFILVEFPREAGRDADAAFAFLMERGIIPRQIGGYGLPHCLRFTVGLEEENRAVVAALSEFAA
ncbi:MAG: histidinol-phosphate transaminase [Rhodospirillaceae bacterium]|nr:histidinol-phosphate transaminase [Rhodospirillaceae bacterium]